MGDFIVTENCEDYTPQDRKCIFFADGSCGMMSFCNGRGKLSRSSKEMEEGFADNIKDNLNDEKRG